MVAEPAGGGSEQRAHSWGPRGPGTWRSPSEGGYSRCGDRKQRGQYCSPLSHLSEEKRAEVWKGSLGLWVVGAPKPGSHTHIEAVGSGSREEWLSKMVMVPETHTLGATFPVWQEAGHPGWCWGTPVSSKGQAWVHSLAYPGGGAKSREASKRGLLTSHSLRILLPCVLAWS